MDHEKIMWQNIIRCLAGYYDHQRREDQLAILNGMILFLEVKLAEYETSGIEVGLFETDMLRKLTEKYESLDFDSE